MSVEKGKTYVIDHSRKGTFVGKILSAGKTWLEVEIVKGRAHYIAYMNQDRGIVGDVITVRRSFCTFAEYKEPTK